MSLPYYVANRAKCSICKRPLDPAESVNDGEPCYRGYHRCAQHPHAEPEYEHGSNFFTSEEAAQIASHGAKALDLAEGQGA